MDDSIPASGSFYRKVFLSSTTWHAACVLHKALKSEGNSAGLLPCLVGALLSAQKCMQVCD